MIATNHRAFSQMLELTLYVDWVWSQREIEQDALDRQRRAKYGFKARKAETWPRPIFQREQPVAERFAAMPSVHPLRKGIR